MNSSRHATRADAADIIDRGWIPTILPESSTDIRESHNVDTNRGHGTFVFGPDDIAEFRSSLRAVAPTESLLRSLIPREEFEQRGYVFYRYEDFDIAVHWQTRRGQFWLTYLR